MQVDILQDNEGLLPITVVQQKKRWPFLFGPNTASGKIEKIYCAMSRVWKERRGGFWSRIPTPFSRESRIPNPENTLADPAWGQNKRAWEQILESDLSCLNLIIKPLLFLTGRRWWQSSAKVTKHEKSKLFSVISKTISVIPYPVSYPLSLKFLASYSLFLKPLTWPF